MYFLLNQKKKENTLKLPLHFVRGKSFVSMSKIHLCGRWQLVNKRTFDSSGCFGRATLCYPTWPAHLSITWLKIQPSAKATWQHRLLQLQLLSFQLLLLFLLLLTGISVSFRFVTRHTHTHTHTHSSTRAAHTHTHTGENNVQPLSANVPNNDLQASAIYMISNKNKLQAIHFT